jgi:hypothetical protein
MVPVVLKAMTAFHQNDNVLEWAMGAVHNLLADRKNAERFVNAKGVGAVVAAMTNFPELDTIQMCGCTIMSECMALLDNRDEWIDNDTLAVVGKTLKNHRGDEELEESARKALEAFSKKD